MNNNQTKGISLIAGGILSMFILPYILRTIGFYWLSYYLTEYYLIYLAGLAVAGLGVKTLLSKDTGSEEENASVITGGSSPAAHANKVSKITLTGGIIGLFAGSSLSALNKRISSENAQGWEVVQVLPDTSLNILTVILRMLLLMITLFLYTTSNGYYIVLKRAS